MAAKSSVENSRLPPSNDNWMAKLPQKLQNIPLNQLSIPGSHDSFSFGLDRSSEIGPDTAQTIRDLVKVFGAMAKDVIYRWSMTQSLTFTQQLNAGIRYFDLRISTRQTSSDIFFLHCLFAHKVEPCLQDINTFLEQHPKEIAILDFNHMYGFNESTHQQMLTMIQGVFGSKLCPVQDMENLTLSQLWKDHLQVIAIYHQDDLPRECNNIWPKTSVRSPWPNTTDVDQMIKFQEQVFAESHTCKDIFLVHQGVLTPDATYIMSRFTGSLRTDLVAKAVPAFIKWLQMKKADSKNLNICVIDYVEKEGFIGQVIEFNK
ncbi:PI-PLC X domain-containing protein 3-like [Gigantopelta aegis]|uniref:PI-PLC X domain-containing protein 3-like n=1 Tax=Gigantopelta aegis TaxID=1735272 RepID=UPI001B88B8AB|nr:PI-PLC X domain-containing protein 3-like [Gigantopelta aegis]